MYREPVDKDTKGNAEFAILESNPLLAGLGAPTMEVNQVCMLMIDHSTK